MNDYDDSDRYAKTSGFGIGELGQVPEYDPADVLARVYALILSWPTADARPTEGDGTVTERSNER